MISQLKETFTVNYRILPQLNIIYVLLSCFFPFALKVYIHPMCLSLTGVLTK